ncbi:Glycosyl transferase, family 2 [Nitrospira sp. KM1]|uniref:dolichyl-phosphate beta-glucosyltransferase n=1 Tax=Nitrospira sp. KM1 TaxID=1936990 RepID=UPI0013A735C0|nr:dolichyl-phosphate beta-glucosyltransferase [Nitrospira sp. KM1]BCA54394.1 Glycosyl transferase, family 2 [Nitrospira sp. KM1]
MVSKHQSTFKSLSVIVPAHNEAARIGPYLDRITNYLNAQGRWYELVVVDDGSRDATASIVRGFAANRPEVKLLRLATRKGKGAAVRRGMQAATGSLKLFTDADGATPIDELSRLEHAIEQGADLAIGSRALASRSQEFRVQAKLYRTWLGGLFNFAVHQLGIAGISDTQCGFKLFRQKAAEDLFSVATINGYGFDLEVLYIAQRRPYRIAEVPVNWCDQPGSKVRVIRDGAAMLRELLLIKHNYDTGRYEAGLSSADFSRAQSTEREVSFNK